VERYYLPKIVSVKVWAVKVAIIAIVGLLLFFPPHFASAIDTPHNASNNINCGSCHGEEILNSPFWGGSYIPLNIDDTPYNKLCLSCHLAPSGPYSEEYAPLEKTHSSLTTDNSYGDWTRECRNCHDPHYQRQKYYKKYDSNLLYLATGIITSGTYNSGDNTTELVYSTIIYKSGWTAAKLTEKTGEYRRTILLPNIGSIGYNYPVINMNEGENKLIVTGNAISDLTLPSTFAVMYGQYVKDKINLDGTNKTVKFFDQSGTNSFADGDSAYNGVCEVCHTQTTHYQNDGTGSDQHHMNIGNRDGTNCVSCHPHTSGFAHGGGSGGSGCDSCHGHSGSHYKHSDVDPPDTVCGDCHDTNAYPQFADHQNLNNTAVCNVCHSPNGAFDGVNDAVIGAKNNWEQGVYLSNNLRAGKEKWCAGCHDNVPSIVDGVTAPDIAGNNTTYGYYLSAHGIGAYGVKRQTVTYAQGECLHCHDVSIGGHGGQLFAPLDDPDFCMKCHTDTGSVQEGGIANGPGNIKTVFNKTYRHNITGYSGIHKFSPQEETRAYLSANKHVECNDCHNPHAVQRGLHSGNTAHISARTNLIPDSGPLTGASGVEPTWSSSNWGGTSSWPTTSSTATKEYQICFKCHANYNTNFASWGGSGTTSWTDVSLEFNPNNQSYHPVVQALPEIDPGYEYYPEWQWPDSDSSGSNRLPPAFVSLLIGDSGKSTSALEGSITDSTKNWTANQWQNWGLRIGTISTLDSSQSKYNGVKRITGNTSTQLTLDQMIFPAPQSTNTTYSIEYYAGRASKSGTMVTDTFKNFSLYMPSLVGYVVVIVNDCGFSCGSNTAKGTVISNNDTSFTVDGWTVLSGSVPADGTVGYYFSAIGKTMMCSDCHSNNTISSTAAQGPHGSAVKWMLKGRNRAWPATSAANNGTGTGTLFTIGKISSPATHRSFNDGTVDGLFCLNCHSTVSFSKNAAGLQNGENVHIIHSWSAGPACINCHVIVPHGSSESRLMGNITMPARYSFNNNTSNMFITYFRKIFDASHTGRAGDPADYRPQGTKQNCYTVGASVGCHHGD
jgi:predicted CXXCH cytochrome family protein